MQLKEGFGAKWKGWRRNEINLGLSLEIEVEFKEDPQTRVRVS